MLTCERCHHENSEGSRFCASCGAELVAPRERREERKVVTVLFADLVGFTSRAERMDVEDLRAVVARTSSSFGGDSSRTGHGREVHRRRDRGRLRRARGAGGRSRACRPRGARDSRCRGRVERARPGARPPHPRRGEHRRSARLRRRERVGRRHDCLRRRRQHRSPSAGLAPTDGVVVGESTYRATSDAIEYGEPLTARVKGKAEPVECWPALRTLSRVGETRRRQDATPLVGRTQSVRR